MQCRRHGAAGLDTTFSYLWSPCMQVHQTHQSPHQCGHVCRSSVVLHYHGATGSPHHQHWCAKCTLQREHLQALPSYGFSSCLMWTDGGVCCVQIEYNISISASWHWLIVLEKVSGWLTYLCMRSLQASIWAPSLGFTLLFGSLVVKTWRIYHIFGKITARNLNKAQFKVKVRSYVGMYSTYWWV